MDLEKHLHKFTKSSAHLLKFLNINDTAKVDERIRGLSYEVGPQGGQLPHLRLR